MNPLDTFEQLTQRFVEGTFHRFFGKRIHPVDLREQLAAQVEAERNGRADHLLPANYQLAVNPTDYAALTRQQSGRAVAVELTMFLSVIAAESNIQFDETPQVELCQDGSVPPGRMRVTSSSAGDGGQP